LDTTTDDNHSSYYSPMKFRDMMDVDNNMNISTTATTTSPSMTSEYNNNNDDVPIMNNLDCIHLVSPIYSKKKSFQHTIISNNKKKLSSFQKSSILSKLIQLIGISSMILICYIMTCVWIKSYFDFDLVSYMIPNDGGIGKMILVSIINHVSSQNYTTNNSRNNVNVDTDGNVLTLVEEMDDILGNDNQDDRFDTMDSMNDDDNDEGKFMTMELIDDDTFIESQQQVVLDLTDVDKDNVVVESDLEDFIATEESEVVEIVESYERVETEL